MKNLFNQKVTFILSICFCLAFQTILSQDYYQSPKGELYTKSNVDSICNAMNDRLKKKGVDMIFKVEILDTINQENKTIYKYKLKGESVAVTQNANEYESLINKPLPEFSFKDIDGNAIESKNLIGKPLVINMWFTTCAPCIAEMPELNRIKKENPDINFIAITFDNNEKVKNFLKKKTFNFIQIANQKAYCDLFTKRFPINIFVNKDGIIKEIEEGMPLIYNRELKEITDKVNPANFEKALELIK